MRQSTMDMSTDRATWNFRTILTRLNTIVASSHQNDRVDTRLDAKRSRTATVERIMRLMQVPMIM